MSGNYIISISNDSLKVKNVRINRVCRKDTKKAKNAVNSPLIVICASRSPVKIRSGPFFPAGCRGGTGNMHALSITRVVGSGVIGLLRNSCQMLSELMAVSSEVEANNAGRNAEAFILCLMPFGITYILSGFTGEYMSLTRKSPLGIFLMLTAFCFAVISCGFLLSLIGGKKKRTQMSVKIAKPVLPLPQNALKALRGILYKTLPESYITRQFEFFSELSCEPEKFFELQIRKTVSVVLFTVPLFIILLHAAKYPVYPAIIAEFILVLLIHHEVSQKVRARRENLMDEIPLFLSMVVTLLQSGVLLPKAIDTCSGAFSDTSTLGSEIQIMKSQILSGMSAGKAIESFSGRTPIPEAQAALLLASRFELTGGSEVLQLLSLQSTACWSLCRNASRKRRERDSLAMAGIGFKRDSQKPFGPTKRIPVNMT